MGGRPATRMGGVDAGARLAICELLVATDDLRTCLQRSVDWLVEHAGVAKAVLAAFDAQSRRSFATAGHGVDRARLRTFTVDLADLDDPMVDALGRAGGLAFSPGPSFPATPLGRTPFVAMPLEARASRGRDPAGLMLAAAPYGRLGDDAIWLAELLGEKLAHLPIPQAFVSGGVNRERRLLYDILDAVPDPVLLTDIDGRLVIANASADRLLGARDDGSVGRRHAVALNNMLFSASVSSHTLGGGAERSEVPLVDPTDGSDLLFEVLLQPVADVGGGACVVSILRNVTDLGHAHVELAASHRRARAAEAEQRAERHRLDLIIDSVADPIVVTNEEGDIVLMNELAERLFLPPPQANEEAQRRVSSNDAHFSSFVANFLVSGVAHAYRAELELVEPASGEPLPVEILAGKVLSESGELNAVVTIFHDRREAIEKARLYDQLKQASEELEAQVHAATAELVEQNELLRRQSLAVEQASSAKSQFLANMSHELRTPLNAIMGYTSMLLQGVAGAMDPQQQKYVSRIESNSTHLLGVINDCLDISRIEAGRMPLHLGEVHLAELIREAVAELEPLILRSKLPVTVEHSDNLPVLRTDRQKVKQILLNLLGNALKFTHEGWVRISTSRDPVEREVAIAVTDTGIGIAPEEHHQVFHDFLQLDNSMTRPYTGTGLGLAICRRLAEMLGGSISLVSEVGKGSTFTLHLPLRQRRR